MPLGCAPSVCHLLADAAIAAAREAQVSAHILSTLPDQWREAVPARADSATGKLIGKLGANPVVDIGHAAHLAHASEAATYRAIDTLVGAGILRSITESRRNQAWAAGAVLDEAEALIRRLAD